MVGSAVPAIGDIDGGSLGNAVGYTDGDLVGDANEEPLGKDDGSDDGQPLGEAVGDGDGDLLGNDVDETGVLLGGAVQIEDHALEDILDAMVSTNSVPQKIFTPNQQRSPLQYIVKVPLP